MKTLMIQGTTSDAGKSTIVAAICRYLSDRKISVVPFKPQNMALNSAVTSEGGEIGRAQALQAKACRIEPANDMNPVLIKPSSDTGAQIIIQGKALTQMDAVGFHDYKKHAMQAVLTSYNSLNSKHDFMVVEGAGSPAEINLREGDIANMGFAEEVDCPVILIADIDKGGVFAHLVGTLDLLSQSEQNRIIGFIINKFRGDISLLQPGIEWLEERTSKPVLGVLPYLRNLYLEEEDAINTQQSHFEESNINKSRLFNVVVIVLPRISNHTDFDSLRMQNEVNLQFVADIDKCPPCDLIIIPGTKSVADDLDWLKAEGWDTHLKKHLRYGGKLIGICGGFQILGEHIHDPYQVENTKDRCKGLGLLPIETTFEEEKHLHNKSGRLTLNGQTTQVEGYEIHHGQTYHKNGAIKLIQYKDGAGDGYVDKDNQIFGCYLHGLFDEPQTCQNILSWAGCSVEKVLDKDKLLEDSLDRLAVSLEENCDMERLFQIIGYEIKKQ